MNNQIDMVLRLLPLEATAARLARSGRLLGRVLANALQQPDAWYNRTDHLLADIDSSVSLPEISLTRLQTMNKFFALQAAVDRKTLAELDKRAGDLVHRAISLGFRDCSYFERASRRTSDWDRVFRAYPRLAAVVIDRIGHTAGACQHCDALREWK
jgi:hypothetical protein